MSRRLIINGDDFGRDRQTDKAVVDSFCHGCLTSASLMPVGEDFRFAVKKTRQKKINVGVHLVFHSEVTRYKYKPLTEEMQELTGGLFGDRFEDAARDFPMRAIIREADAQVEKILDAKIEPWFIDSHMKFMSALDCHYVPLINHLVKKYPMKILLYKDLKGLSAMARKRVLYAVYGLGGNSKDGVCNRIKSRLRRGRMHWMWLATHVSTDKKNSKRYGSYQAILDKDIARVIAESGRILHPCKNI